LVDLTAKKLADLAGALSTEAQSRRYPKKQILEFVNAALKRNEIDLAAVKDGVLEDIKAGSLSVSTGLQRLSSDIATAFTRAWNRYRGN
jgi:hypothetical protein